VPNVHGVKCNKSVECLPMQELKRAGTSTGDKVTPSKFLNPHVRYLPKFETEVCSQVARCLQFIENLPLSYLHFVCHILFLKEYIQKSNK